MASPNSLLAARSYLFVPADRPDRYAKAWNSPADEVIVDLEDAVSPENKDSARASLLAWLAPERPVWIRINATDSPWFTADLRLLANPGVRGIMLPKAEVLPSALLALCSKHALPVLPIIESAWGIQNAYEIGLCCTNQI